MKTKFKHIRLLLAVGLAVAFSFAQALPVLAQSQLISDKNAEVARDLGNLIREKRLLTENITSLSEIDLSEFTPNERLRHLRQYTQGTISLSYKLNPNEILPVYQNAVTLSGTERDKAVFELQKKFLDNFDSSKPNSSSDAIIELLQAETLNPDWFVANISWLLLSISNSYADNPTLALQQTHQAYKLIPNEISEHVTDARILTLTQTAHLNNLLLNPGLAIENTVELIEQSQSAGYPVDGSSLLNNLLYSLTMWREYEVSTDIANIVLDIEKDVGSNNPGLTELRVAQLLDRQSDFDGALVHIRRGLGVVEIPVLKNSLLFLEINSLAGSGKVEEAAAKLAILEKAYGNKKDDKIQSRITRAKLGLAIHNNDKKNIYSLYNQLLDYKTQSHLRSYSANTSKLVASLENTKERQAEREAGLKREANLQRSKAEQKARVNQLLMVLVALLSLAAICAVIFARFRDKVSRQLTIKTREAEDADRMKTEFLGMVSHELRTPLNGIVGIADLLAMKAPSADLRHKAGIILDSSNKLTHVIESIVDMSRIDGGKMELYPESTDIRAIVTELDRLWRPIIENNGVTFTSFVEPSLSESVMIDKERFSQCLDSLLSNAAKFTDRGRVHLHITGKPVVDTDEVEITAIIADTGQGMSQTVQEKLFTPFLQADSTMTRKHGGSGLGLAITQSLARMMGGDVKMLSKQDRGSEFTLTVRAEKSDDVKILDNVEKLLDMTPSEAINPKASLESSQKHVVSEGAIISGEAEDELLDFESSAVAFKSKKTLDVEIDTPPSQPLPAARPHMDSLRGLKVLIVEDIAANQDVIKLFLVPEGCETQSAHNGIEALNVLSTQAIDIILMDIRMPEMDGIEAMRAIRKSGREYKNTPIIALTADTSAETNAACMAAGADIFLTKPIMARELIESIQFIRHFKDYDVNGAISAA